MEEDELGPWPEFLAALMQMSEERCWELLALEHTGRNRFAYVQRLYGRANKLRALRERLEWLGGSNE